MSKFAKIISEIFTSKEKKLRRARRQYFDQMVADIPITLDDKTGEVKLDGIFVGRFEELYELVQTLLTIRLTWDAAKRLG